MLGSCASLGGVAGARPPVGPPLPEPAQRFAARSGAIDFAAGIPVGAELSSLELAGGRLRLAAGAAEGSFVSGPLALPAWNWLVPSWRMETPSGSSVDIAFQAWVNGAWTGWYPLGTWSEKPRSASMGDGQGRVEVDTLILSGTSERLRVRLVLRAGPSPDALPAVDSLGWVVRDLFASVPADPAALAAIPDIELEVPARSQMVEDPAIASKICSPTSISMALARAGIELPTASVAQGVYDHGAGIYGNWSFNMAYLGGLGLKARVDWFPSLAEVARELQAGNLVVASVAFGAGALPGAPIASTAGHLILIRGFTHREGKLFVICNDPAAPDTGSVRREYPADRFDAAWKNVVYVIGK
jgi:hypothetical protein